MKGQKMRIVEGILFLPGCFSWPIGSILFTQTTIQKIHFSFLQKPGNILKIN